MPPSEQTKMASDIFLVCAGAEKKNGNPEIREHSILSPA